MWTRLIVPLIALMLAAPMADAQLRKGGPGGAKRREMLERFSRMSPEQRERALSRLPYERRRQIERNLEIYNELPVEQKRRLQTQYENFQQLPPERQQAARQVFRRMRDLPPERRQEIRREVIRMGRMPEPRRRAYVISDEFRNHYSPDERRMIDELSGILSQ
ncbi:MAG TPA: DUF3106 domain-containing protein [Bryobacteraceae bacterium]|nr:DUF3106 domain-containing protein [Bryobacteraceae bacterium]